MLVAPWDPAGAERRSIIFLLILGCSNVPVCLGAALTRFPGLPLPLSVWLAWEIWSSAVTIQHGKAQGRRKRQ